MNRVKNFVNFVSALSLLMLTVQTVNAADNVTGCLKAKVAKIGDQELAYYESSGQGAPVVLVHGNSFSSWSFAKQLCGSLGSQYHIVAVDLPGHGRSSDAVEPAAVYNVPGYAEALVGLVNELDLEDAVFAGWSLGGHVLLEAAQSLPQASGFMIFGTPPIGLPPTGTEFLTTSPAAGLGFVGNWDNTLLELFVSSIFAPGTTDIPDFFFKDGRRTDGEARAQLLASFVAANYSDEVVIVQNLSVPLAIVHGGKDQLVNLAYIQQLNIPNLWGGKVHVIPEAGHTPQWETPEKFNALLSQFVKDVAGQ